MTTNGLPDPVEEAIRSTEPEKTALEQLTITISSTGRPCILGFPVDMTEAELFEVVGFLSTGLRGELIKRAAKRKTGVTLEVARSLPGGLRPA